MTVLPRHEEEARKFLEKGLVSSYQDLAALIAAAEERIWERAERACEKEKGEGFWPTATYVAAIRAAKEEG